MPTERLCFLLRRWNACDTVRVKLRKLKLLHEVSRTAAYYAGTEAEGAEGGSLLRPLRPPPLSCPRPEDDVGEMGQPAVRSEE